MKSTFEIPHSKYVDITKDKDEKLSIYIDRPCENMQTNSACFEALAITHMAAQKCTKVEISFALDENWSGSFHAITNANYMRFLYRLMHFVDDYEWASVKQGVCTKEVGRFINAFEDSDKKLLNRPNSDSKYNPNKGGEHILEKWFVDKICNLGNLHKMACIYDQFPTGVFLQEVSEKTRILPTGYFDLWGIDTENNLCIFELKKPDNKPLGIVSELYFYTSLVGDMVNKKISLPPLPQKPYRGYEEFLKAIKSRAKIRSFFLVGDPGLHSHLVKHLKAVIDILNKNKHGHHYEVLFYNAIEASLHIAEEKRRAEAE